MLDADTGPRLKSSTGHVAARDIVQFVPMNRVQGKWSSSAYENALMFEFVISFDAYKVFTVQVTKCLSCKASWKSYLHSSWLTCAVKVSNLACLEFLDNSMVPESLFSLKGQYSVLRRFICYIVNAHHICISWIPDWFLGEELGMLNWICSESNTCYNPINHFVLHLYHHHPNSAQSSHNTDQEFKSCIDSLTVNYNSKIQPGKSNPQNLL